MQNKLSILITIILFTFQIGWGQQTVGTLLNSAESYDGYTLFAPSVSQNTYLVDNCGHLVKSWESEYRPNFSTYLLEDGSLLRAVNIPAATQNGFARGGIEKYNWSGTLTWQYSFVGTEFSQHHDIEPMPNGNILVIVFEEIPMAEAIANGRDPFAITGAIWPEKIIEIQPVGTNEIEIVWEWSAWDHIVQDYDPTKANYGVIADHPEKIDVNFGNVSNGDWMHFNAIDYNATLDQIVVSSRTFDEIFIIDHSTTTQQATTNAGGDAGKGGDLLYRWGNPLAYDRGEIADKTLYGQHNVTWIDEGLVDEGKLMVFNNGVTRPDSVFSTIDVFEPPVDAAGNYILEDNQPYGPDDLSWTYASTNGTTFYSSKLSGAQRLPNGNTLICHGNSSRLFEVTYDSEIVWEYESPISATGPIAQGEVLGGSSIFRTLRYGADYPAFQNVNVSAGPVLELDPGESNCQLFDNILNTNEALSEDFVIAPNPVSDEFVIQNSNNRPELIKVFSISGHQIFSIQSADNQVSINAREWPAGCYFVQISDLDGQLLQVSKLIK